MFQGDLELEPVFSDHGVCSEVITDSLALERAIYGRCSLVQPPPSASQLANRRKNARLLTDLVAVFALPPHTSGLALQILDLAYTWSDSDAGDIDLSNILALTAAVYMFIKLDPPLPQQRYAGTLLELLSAVAELLTPMTFQLCIQGRQFSRLAAPRFTFFDTLGFELASPTPAAWRRLSL